MKYLILIAALFLVVHASRVELQPGKLQPGELQPGDYEKNVGEIWSNCSKTSDKAQIIKVTITPDPPKIGQNVTIQAEILYKEEVTKGDIEATVKYSIFSQTLHFDLCDSLKQAGISCPVEAGIHRFSGSVAVPELTPPGHYSGDAKVTDQNGDELGCVDFDFHLER